MEVKIGLCFQGDVFMKSYEAEARHDCEDVLGYIIQYYLYKKFCKRTSHFTVFHLQFGKLDNWNKVHKQKFWTACKCNTNWVGLMKKSSIRDINLIFYKVFYGFVIGSSIAVCLFV